MPTLNASTARKTFYRIIDEVNESHAPVTVMGKRNTVVILSEQDWQDIQETLYISSIPGLKTSILESGREPISSGVAWKPRKNSK